jgi:alginate O-acetyltransferase complex protein AlgI
MARLLWLWTGNAWLATPPLLLGLSLLVHFGLFGVASTLWRRAGFACPDAFTAPQKATSLSDFWGRRWNGPFSDLMRNTVYRPVAGIGFPAAALYAAFLFSGVLHELAISLPARAGYGRPLAYFALQGLFVLAERTQAPGFPTRFWAWIAILAPLPLLLVPEFLRTAIWPLAGIR